MLGCTTFSFLIAEVSLILSPLFLSLLQLTILDPHPTQTIPFFDDLVSLIVRGFLPSLRFRQPPDYSASFPSPCPVSEASQWLISRPRLQGALLATFLSLIVEAAMFLWLQRELLRRREKRTKLLLSLCSLSAFVVIAGLFAMVSGTVSSIIAIHDSLKSGNTSR